MDYNAANEFLKTRLSLPTELSSKGISENLTAAIRAHCFFSARVAEARVLEELRSVSDQYSAGKLGFAEGRKVLAKWLDAHAIGDPKSARMSNIASSMRLDLILRQNAAMAAAVGRYQVSRDPDIEERWPCWRYIAGHNPRGEHKALDGKVIRKDDPFWHSHYPPWDFNCNCDVEDSDEKPDPTPQHDDHAPASGFQFDPAHAFEKVDPLSIKDPDLRDKAIRSWEERMENFVTEPTPGDIAKGVGRKQFVTRGVYFDGEKPFPADINYKKLKPVFNAMKTGEDDFAKLIAEKGASMDREFIGIWDEEGSPFWVGMGPKGMGLANFPEIKSGCTLIHNHPKGSCFSGQDVMDFIRMDMKKIVAATWIQDDAGNMKLKKFTLTNTGKGDKLLLRSDVRRLYDEALLRKKNEFEAWKEVLNGTCYEIRYD